MNCPLYVENKWNCVQERVLKNCGLLMDNVLLMLKMKFSRFLRLGDGGRGSRVVGIFSSCKLGLCGVLRALQC